MSNEREIPAATADDFNLDLEREWQLFVDYTQGFGDWPDEKIQGLLRLAAHYKREAERLEAELLDVVATVEFLDSHYAREIRSRIESTHKEAGDEGA